MDKPIPYGRQYIDKDDIEAVVKVLKGDYLTTGPYVQEFEKRFAQKVGAKYGVAVSSGTAALHLACMAAAIGPGDEVITSPMTFAASANCAAYVGAKPVFADIERLTGNIDVVEIEKQLTEKTRALIPVHYTGLPCDMETINQIARRHNLIVIEDACHALGARYRDTVIGDCTYSDMTVFSFHPVKHITTGEGGMITTNSKELFEKLKLLRNHGISRDESIFDYDSHGPWYYEMQELGLNYRITDIQCALGLSQLNKLERFVKKRREIAQIYNQSLADLPLDLPVEPEGCYSSYHLYTVKLRDIAKIDRNKFYHVLRAKNILAQVHYIPVHTMPYYQREWGYRWNDYPVAEDHYKRVISLPLYPGLSDNEIDTVIQVVKEVLA